MHVIKQIFILCFCSLIIATHVGGAPADKALAAMAEAQTRVIVRCANIKSQDELAGYLRPSKPSENNRHAVTPESVIWFLSGVDPNDLRISNINVYEERNLVIVRISQPIRIELEFYYDKTAPAPLLLHSMHP